MKRKEIEAGAVLLNYASKLGTDWSARLGLGQPVTVVTARPHTYEEKTITRSTGGWHKAKVAVPTDKGDGVLVREFPDYEPTIVRLRDLHGDYDRCRKIQATNANANAVAAAARADADAAALRIQDEAIARTSVVPGVDPHRDVYATGRRSARQVEINAQLLLAMLDALPADFAWDRPESGR